MATFNEQLHKLDELCISSRDTIAVLLSHEEDDFAREVVNSVYDRVANKNSPDDLGDEYDTSDDVGSILDSKLMFLEELLQEPAEVQMQVREWLTEPKRRFLFDYSSQAQLYGELLLAKAKGTLEEFVRSRNPAVSLPEEFIYDKKLGLDFDPNNKLNKEDPLALIKLKLEAVIKNMEQDYKQKPNYERWSEGDFLGLFWKSYGALERAAETTKGGLKEICRREVLEYIKDFESGIQRLEFSLIDDLRSGLNILERDKLATMIELGCDHGLQYPLNADIDIPATLLEENILKIKTQLETETYEEEQRIITDEATQIREKVLESRESIYVEQGSLLRLTLQQKAELELLQREVYGMPDVTEINLSDKLNKPKPLEYSIRLEHKDPLDVKYGNDSGCCIGVYENTESIDNADTLPQMLVDNSTYFFGIYQKIGQSKERRVGIILGYQAQDIHENKVLACNSIELSPKMNPASEISKIVTFAEEALREFGIRNGYSAVIMSAHDYNTSYNFSQRKTERCSGLGVLTKPVTTPPEPFYSEIVSEEDYKTIDTEEEGELDDVFRESGFYTIYDAQKQS